MSRDRDVMPLRYAEMARSPLAFNRGSDMIMASDLALGPISGLRAQLCGDAHVCNFGIFLNAADAAVFDFRDFDETLPGPWEWDVERLLVSLEVAAREAHAGVAARRHIVGAAVGAYVDAMRMFAGAPYLKVLYSRVPPPDLEQAAGGSPQDSIGLSPLDRRAPKAPRMLTSPPQFNRIDDLMPGDEAALVFGQTLVDLAAYERTLGDDRKFVLDRYELRDMATELGDIPAIGLHTNLLLMVEKETARPLLLQLREARRSILEAFAGRSRYPHSGRRVLEGMRLIKSQVDVLLGAVRAPATEGPVRDYYVRQRPRPAGPWEPERLAPAELRALGQACATLLARAHALSGDRVAIARYLGSAIDFTGAMENFASSYADQNLRDYESFLSAVEHGRIIVRRAA